MKKYGKGWFNESRRHSLARQGIKTGRKNHINYMFSLGTIKSMNRQRGKEAKELGKEPLLYTGIPSDLRKIPNIGDYRPNNWKIIHTYFVDSSGFGRPGEPALTFDEFTNKVKEGKGYAIIEAGQFQVVIGEFERVDKINMAKKIKRNKTCDNELLFSPITGEQYSACRGDYWNVKNDFVFKDSEGNTMQLVQTGRNELGNIEIIGVIKKEAKKKDLLDIV